MDCSGPSGNGKCISRRRNKPHMYDPSPPASSTRRDRPYKRCRGRPRGSGRKQTVHSLHVQGELGIGKEGEASVESLTRSCNRTNVYISPSLRSNDNNQLEPLQFGEQVIHVNTSPVILQNKQHSQNLKEEPQYVAVNHQPCTTCGQQIQETTNSPACHEVQRTGSDPQCGHEREGAFDNNRGSYPSGSTSQAGSYIVNEILAPILHAIINRHGDIAKDCSLESGYMRTSALEGICKIVLELQRIRLTEFDSVRLSSYNSILKDADKMKIDVKWLQDRLDQIQEVVESNVEVKKLIDLKTKRMEQVEGTKTELQNLLSEIEAKERQLEQQTLEIEELSDSIIGKIAVSQRFQGMSLLDGLL
ncbi:uncharacterized protein LOC132307909 [Cornus florida]|uniref:uncharacterized protein LOC132307909 n=1 Tax=Cornus florida TaxID=4283 RepID=UPI0028A05A2A|nr:uncharacterized protein LOC132307909 [Cornus florida]